MSVTNLFNFSRSLPAPFDTLRNKKVKVSSKYGSGMESTLCSSAIKAIHALCRCMDGSSEGAVGTIDNRTVAEYKPQKLLDIELEYPVNAMTRICKKLSLPKKAAVEAIAMFEMSYGGGSATAHDVFMALQEIPFILKSQNTPESKMLVIEENMARALTLKWSDYDLAKAVSY